jgi:hypothetical protein
LVGVWATCFSPIGSLRLIVFYYQLINTSILFCVLGANVGFVCFDKAFISKGTSG